MIPIKPIVFNKRIQLYKPQHPKYTVIKALPMNQIIETSYFIGKNILLFTMFYTGLNYLYYKDLNDKNKK